MREKKREGTTKDLAAIFNSLHDDKYVYKALLVSD